MWLRSCPRWWATIKDAVAILAIVVLNAILGFVQEYRAEQAMAALKKLAVPAVRVRRDGAVQEINALQLAPGDVVLLEAGNLVPADGRLCEAANLRIQEAILTGESEAVEKNTAALATTSSGAPPWAISATWPSWALRSPTAAARCS